MTPNEPDKKEKKSIRDLKIGDEFELIKGLKMKLKKIVFSFDDDDGTEMDVTFDKSNGKER